MNPKKAAAGVAAGAKKDEQITIPAEEVQETAEEATFRIMQTKEFEFSAGKNNLKCIQTSHPFTFFQAMCWSTSLGHYLRLSYWKKH